MNNKTCVQCGSVFGDGKHSSNMVRQRFCSKRCFHDHRNETREELFWSYVNKEAAGGCWEWTGCLMSRGYGYTTIAGKLTLAHRISYRLLRGDPGEKFVLHKCHNRKCVNPEHLYLGSFKENTADMIAAGRDAMRGDRSHRRKLSSSQVQSIRAEYRKDGPHKASPSNTRELAAKYGVTVGAITSIISGRSWRYP